MRRILVLSYRLLICAGFCLATANAATRPGAMPGGGMDSGGGELHDLDYGVAWFLGDGQVRYCLEVDAGFPLKKAVVEETVRSVLDAWNGYIRQKSINRPGSDHAMWLATDYRELAHCDGTEDLKFYLGGSSAEVEAAKSRFTHPVSFAYRTAYEKKAGWGKGFIWVAPQDTAFIKLPDWHKPFALYGMLLHEMGHVLGCPHVAGTIMDEDIAIYLMEDPDKLKKRFSRIDLTRELALCEGNCSHVYVGQLGLLPEIPDDVQLNQLFRRLMNRDRVGDAHAEARYHGEISASGSLVNHLILHVEDAKGGIDFPLTISGDPIGFGGQGVFLRYREYSMAPGGLESSMERALSEGKILSATLTTVGGKELPLLVERNSLNPGSPLVIEMMEGAKHTPIFGVFGH